MPAAGSVFLLATVLIVGGLVLGLAVIVTLLLRISSALADASHHLGLIPDQLAELGPTVSRYTGSISRFREQVDAAG